ncbi:hypothetical protein IWW34DRAFT_706362 [Fusarium oxysporum f. sp. albedinis]|nr:hypothetical protein IWW34DRAFT_706362 [Fusarium oxysporum f. sp. albedinis]
MDLASIYFGLFLGVFVFTFAKAVQQTRGIWRRTQSLHHGYLYMIWVEAWVNFVFALVTFLYLNDIVPGSVGFYLFTGNDQWDRNRVRNFLANNHAVALWAIQTQLLPQIIANRVALIMTNKRRARKLKWGLVLAIGCINIAVAYIWTVAHLDGATPFQVHLNLGFEKAEKSFFLVVDLALNLYFLYLVRFRLIADGLSKYWKLFNFNAGMVVISTSMDILLLGFLSLPDPYLYVQFAPLAYIVKLYIELLMANLISKVVRSGAAGRGDGHRGSSSHKSNPTNYITSRVVVSGSHAMPKSGNTILSKLGKDERLGQGSCGSEIHLATYPGPHGITKTVETTVAVDAGDDGRSSDTTSTVTINNLVDMDCFIALGCPDSKNQSLPPLAKIIKDKCLGIFFQQSSAVSLSASAAFTYFGYEAHSHALRFRSSGPFAPRLTPGTQLWPGNPSHNEDHYV